MDFKRLMLFIFSLLIVYCSSVETNQHPLNSQITTISQELLNEFNKVAKLIDISYCISSFTKIRYPFGCNICQDFQNTTIIFQFTSDTPIGTSFTITGYLAINHELKEIYLSLRGTRSINDSLFDLNIDLVDYENINIVLSKCEECKVHDGFYELFINSLTQLNEILVETLNKYHHHPNSLQRKNGENYKFLIMGHSLGGAIALFLQLHYKDIGYTPILTTMGQPLVGNNAFASWVDTQLGSHKEIQEREYFRVIHKNDLIASLPNWIAYEQFDNQIYISSSKGTDVECQEVVICSDKEDVRCVAGELPYVFNLENHLSYFRKIGECGISIPFRRRKGVVH